MGVTMSRELTLRGLKRQRGYGFWGIAFNVLVLGGFLVLVLRIAPAYMTYMEVRGILERVAEGYDPRSDGMQDIRTRLRKLLNSSQVYAIKVEDIEIFRDRGNIVIDATYEARFPLVWIIDGVMKFDDLVVQLDGADRT